MNTLIRLKLFAYSTIILAGVFGMLGYIMLTA